MGDVEIVRRVSKGKVKRIELNHINAYVSASTGTQTDEVDVVADVKDMFKGGQGWRRESGRCCTAETQGCCS